MSLEAPVDNNIDNLKGFFVKSVITAANRTIPVKSIRINSSERPPYPKHILEIIMKKQEFKKLCKQFDDPQLKTELNALTKEFKTEKAKHSDKIFENLVEKVGPNPTSSRQFWQRINKFRIPKSASSVGSLMTENKELTNANDKAAAFASVLMNTYSSNIMSTSFDNDFFLSTNQKTESLISEYERNENNYSNRERMPKEIMN